MGGEANTLVHCSTGAGAGVGWPALLLPWEETELGAWTIHCNREEEVEGGVANSCQDQLIPLFLVQYPSVTSLINI